MSIHNLIIYVQNNSSFIEEKCIDGSWSSKDAKSCKNGCNTDKTKCAPCIQKCDRNMIQLCTEDGQSDLYELCPEGSSCNTKGDACACDSSQNGQSVCKQYSDDYYQWTCTNNEWVPKQCPDGCDDNAKKCKDSSQCSQGDIKCGRDEQNNSCTLQCNDKGQWEIITQCPNGCDATKNACKESPVEPPTNCNCNTNDIIALICEVENVKEIYNCIKSCHNNKCDSKAPGFYHDGQNKVYKCTEEHGCYFIPVDNSDNDEDNVSVVCADDNYVYKYDTFYNEWESTGCSCPDENQISKCDQNNQITICKNGSPDPIKYTCKTGCLDSIKCSDSENASESSTCLNDKGESGNGIRCTKEYGCYWCHDGKGEKTSCTSDNECGECLNDDTRCNINKIEVCKNGKWEHKYYCAGKCENNQCNTLSSFSKNNNNDMLCMGYPANVHKEIPDLLGIQIEHTDNGDIVNQNCIQRYENIGKPVELSKCEDGCECANVVFEPNTSVVTSNSQIFNICQTYNNSSTITQKYQYCYQGERDKVSVSNGTYQQIQLRNKWAGERTEMAFIYTDNNNPSDSYICNPRNFKYDVVRKNDTYLSYCEEMVGDCQKPNTDKLNGLENCRIEKCPII